MLVIVFAMVVIVAAAGVLVAVIAYPAQGRELPSAPGLNDALAKVADRLGLGSREQRDGDPFAGSGARSTDGRS